MAASNEIRDRPDPVLVLPGLPPNLSGPEDEKYVYPSSTLAFVKAMRSEGVAIELAVPRDEAVFVSHNSVDIWLPMLEFSLAMLAGAGGNLISSMITNAFKRDSDGVRAHIDWRVKEPDGTTHRFKFTGAPKAAARAAELFEASLRSPDDDVD